MMNDESDSGPVPESTYLRSQLEAVQAKNAMLNLMLKTRPPDESAAKLSQSVKDIFLGKRGLGIEKLADAMLLSRSSVSNKMSGYSCTTVFDLFLMEEKYPGVVDFKATILELGRLRKKKLAHQGKPRALGKKGTDFIHPDGNVPQ
tara:strand:- start:305 stop:742 length:438 start_codon:yes stop_codon:yes gene_type:complete